MARLYENKHYKILSKVGFFIIMFVLTVAGGIDVFRYAIAPISGWKEFSAEEVKLAKRISIETPPDAIFLSAPTFNHPVFLSGRKSLMGYSAHIWSHGYNDAHRREQDVQKMLKGKLDAISLIDKYKPSFVTVGPHEKRIGVNKGFFDTYYTCVMSTKNYKVYDLTQKQQSIVASNEYPQDGDKQKWIKQGHGLYVSYYGNSNWEGILHTKKLIHILHLIILTKVKNQYQVLLALYGRVTLILIRQARTYLN